MSVSETILLPAQPTTGITQIVPLGGDGMTAPMSMSYTEADQTGDATGGTTRIIFRLEEAHAHMVAWLAVQVDSASADEVSLINLVWGARGENLADSLVMIYNTGGGGNGAYGVWKPPPLMIEPRPVNPALNTGGAPYIEAYVANSDGEVLKCTLLTYQFHPNARSVTPFPLLAANFPS